MNGIDGSVLDSELLEGAAMEVCAVTSAAVKAWADAADARDIRSGLLTDETWLCCTGWQHSPLIVGLLSIKRRARSAAAKLLAGVTPGATQG